MEPNIQQLVMAHVQPILSEALESAGKQESDMSLEDQLKLNDNNYIIHSFNTPHSTLEGTNQTHTPPVYPSSSHFSKSMADKRKFSILMEPLPDDPYSRKRTRPARLSFVFLK